MLTPIQAALKIPRLRSLAGNRVSQTHGPNLALNPGFETAGAGGADVFANWLETAGGGVIERTTGAGEVYEGAAACKVSRTSANAFVVLVVTVEAEAIYRLRFATRGDGSNQGRYGIYDGNNSVYIKPLTVTGVTSTTYSLVEYEFTVPSGCTSIQVQLFSSTVNGSVCYFDAVEVQKKLNFS